VLKVYSGISMNKHITYIMEMVIIMAVEVLLLFVAMGVGLFWEQE